MIMIIFQGPIAISISMATVVRELYYSASYQSRSGLQFEFEIMSASTGILHIGVFAVFALCTLQAHIKALYM